jgi:hypothetical protein
MDVLKAAQTYVKKMITEVPGMKVLLLDQHTVRGRVDLSFHCACAPPSSLVHTAEEVKPGGR